MNIFIKFVHFFKKKEKELLSINNITKFYHSWKRWRASSQDQVSQEGSSCTVARTPQVPNETIRAVARVPGSQQVAPRLVARAPTRAEVMPRQYPQNQDTAPAPSTQVIDVQPVEQAKITKESADQGKNFFNYFKGAFY
jgi:hypothetical protein